MGFFYKPPPGIGRHRRGRPRHGDLLIVGVNSDASVRRNKGPSRPINPEKERAEVLAALDCVDAVSIFDDDTPAAIVRRVEPDVLVKGADWPSDQIVGRDTVEARGGRVILEPVERGYSTTSIIERIKNLR
jgi:D-beta-D-heptose 7-phosphate kinase/D-beta-D-heptose 1-phosphate adenosyltransferase